MSTSMRCTRAPATSADMTRASTTAGSCSAESVWSKLRDVLVLRYSDSSVSHLLAWRKSVLILALFILEREI